MATALYLTVTGRGSRDAVERYLYRPATVLEHSLDLDTTGYVVAIVQVVLDTEREATSLTGQIRDRLASGLYGASIHETLASARAAFDEAYEPILARL